MGKRTIFDMGKNLKFEEIVLTPAMSQQASTIEDWERIKDKVTKMLGVPAELLGGKPCRTAREVCMGRW